MNSHSSLPPENKVYIHPYFLSRFKVKNLKKKIYGTIVVAVSILLLVPGLTGAQHSHVVQDPQGDVVLETYTDRIEGVERPNVDIVKAEMSEKDGMVTVSLTVKGTITSSPDIHYYIWIHDGGVLDGAHVSGGIIYSNGECRLERGVGHEVLELAATGVGTSKLSVSFALEEIGNPSYLYISRVETFEYFMNAAEELETYMDEAEPLPHEIPKKDTGDEDDDSPGFPFLLMCAALVFAVLVYHKKKQ